ncbi:MAG: hypothetical protein M3478_01980, partial [Planctomycetota bacterium]|nr:hypothetical protein [Planctomycetota bacterium]
TPAAQGSPAAPAPPAAKATPGVPLRANDRDREIERLIARNSLTDAVESNATARDRDKVEPQLVNALYGAAAKRVYFSGGRAVVQLPDDPPSRAQCFKIAAAHLAAKGLAGPAPSDSGQRYLEFELKKPVEPRTR